MSLNVPADLLERAAAGEVPDEQFVGCVRESLPYAWTVIRQVAAEVNDSSADFADHEIPPPSEAERGELLRALASDAIRGGLAPFRGEALLPELSPGRRLPAVRGWRGAVPGVHLPARAAAESVTGAA